MLFHCVCVVLLGLHITEAAKERGSGRLSSVSNAQRIFGLDNSQFRNSDTNGASGWQSGSGGGASNTGQGGWRSYPAPGGEGGSASEPANSGNGKPKDIESKTMKYKIPDENALADVKMVLSEECGDIYLTTKGILVENFKSSVQFNKQKVNVTNKSGVIPGCFDFVAEDVKIEKRMRNLKAEIEMRLLDGHPSRSTMPCGKPDENSCYCGTESTCMFCGFCNSLTRSEVSEVKVERKRLGNEDVVIGEDSCNCEPIEPGTYTISAKVCTPTLQEMKEHAPVELQHKISEGKPVPLFITLYLYDIDFDMNGPFANSHLAKTIMFRQRATNTVGCHLMGTLVHLTPAPVPVS